MTSQAGRPVRRHPREEVLKLFPVIITGEC